jgi:hypothetical protein
MPGKPKAPPEHHGLRGRCRAVGHWPWYIAIRFELRDDDGRPPTSLRVAQCTLEVREILVVSFGF